MRLHLHFSICCLIFWAPGQAMAKSLPAFPGTATVIALDGQPEWLDGRAWRPVALGQLFGPGDRLRCGGDASLQCVVDSRLGLALDASTECALPEPPAGGIGVELVRGRLALLADPGQYVELSTDNAVIQCGPGATDLEVTAGGLTTQLCAAQAGARLSDPKRLKVLELPPYSSAILSDGRLLGPASLGKRDLSDINARWERARLFYGQRKELLKAMAAMPEHSAFVHALKKRKARVATLPPSAAPPY
jgi:hypothetical protein